MALLNEVVWRTQSTDFWVSFKVFGLPVLTILFILTQMPFLNRHAGRASRSSRSQGRAAGRRLRTFQAPRSLRAPLRSGVGARQHRVQQHVGAVGAGLRARRTRPRCG